MLKTQMNPFLCTPLTTSNTCFFVWQLVMFFCPVIFTVIGAFLLNVHKL
jgi:hypothetical protein